MQEQSTQPWTRASPCQLCCWLELQGKVPHLRKEDRAHLLLHPTLADPTRAGHWGLLVLCEDGHLPHITQNFKLATKRIRVMNSQGYESHSSDTYPHHDSWVRAAVDIHSPFTPSHSRINHGVYQQQNPPQTPAPPELPQSCKTETAHC